MRKLLQSSIYLIISISLFTSCEAWEDESYHPGDTNNGEDVTIPGVWKLTELNLEEPFDFNQDGTANTSLMAETNCYQNELMSFLPNNTGISTSNSYAQITIDGENYTVECVEETEETNFTWSQTQNDITVVIDGQTVTAVLSGNKLTYTIPEGFMTGPNGEGGFEILQDITFVFTKQ
ncbi:hypothetical protein [Moheibacter sediminis]|uniref:Lipocalin-like domain-containing protein n=1 Tax=Moheibacter sediminis TaxID=1434700 RepID=A0A1W1YDQ0_9FLAO|nr:hypothetical protein [Moheibacter sediminis]SMC33931.1 hypothetical protein SAMN06296427_101269 [Moheibacter sediminis]